MPLPAAKHVRNFPWEKIHIVILKTLLTAKKHSSGDLQSRLKTRKILGVGETDNGDVHRSKARTLKKASPRAFPQTQFASEVEIVRFIHPRNLWVPPSYRSTLKCLASLQPKKW
ncbi:hypothetical protein TNIN_90371, partial [Trichonephila inaurata madagascariensis]